MNSDSRRKTRLNHRTQAIGKLGGKCATCGEDDIRVLQIDHVNNDGFKDHVNVRKELPRYVNMGMRRMDDLQVLCANCHAIKTWHPET